jgi:hypothetical protein
MIFFLSVGDRLALVLVGRVHVGGTGGELGGAGIDALVDRAHAQCMAALAHRRLGRLQQLGQTTVGETLALEVAQFFAVNEENSLPCVKLQDLDLDDLLDLRQEPRIDLGQVENFVERHADAEGIGDVPEALRRGPSQLLDRWFRGRSTSLKPSTPTSRPRRAFCSDSWKVRPMAITSPTDFICVVRRESASGISRRRNAAPW